MHAILDSTLKIYDPGEYRLWIAKQATYRIKGRIPAGQRRVVRFFRSTPEYISVPRGLLPRIKKRIPGLRVIDQRLSLPARDFGWRRKLRPYQTQAVRSLVQMGGGVLVSPAGSGKTTSALAAVAATKQPALWLVHTLDLAQQAMSEARKCFNLPPNAYGFIGERRTEIGPSTAFCVAMIQTLAKMPRPKLRSIARRFGTVVVDECFPAGTLVDGRPIETIKVGDTVTAFDDRNEEFVKARVVRTFKNPAPYWLVRLDVGGGKEIVSTPNHPFWTGWLSGWKDACDLRVDDFLTEKIGEFQTGIGPIQRERVTSKKYAPDGYVYNLEVERYHTYTANGFVVHNCHRSPSRSMAAVLSEIPARVKIGVTATPDREDGLGPLMYHLLGPGSVTVPRAYLVKAGFLVAPEVRMVKTPFRYHPLEGDKQGWASLQRARAGSADRNRAICELAAKEFKAGHVVVILVGLKSHARLLERALTQGLKVQAVAVTGEMDPYSRERIKRDVEAGKRILIATQLFDEGIDMPRLDRLILAAPIKSKIKVEQQTGRTARPSQLKQGAIVYDFADTNVKSLHRHAKRRLALYQKLGYEVRVMDSTEPRTGTAKRE